MNWIECGKNHGLIWGSTQPSA